MARSIEDIKGAMTREWMENEDVARAYGFEPGTAFSAVFSRVSVESLMFYIVAAASWAVESIVERHKAEVEGRMAEMVPHRAKWYRDKTLEFMKGKALNGDSDRYDTAGMSDAEVERARVVKWAAATENADSSILTIKVAGGGAGSREPLDGETEEQLAAYIGEIKDAGVRVNLVNREPEALNCVAEIYYDAMVGAGTVEAACRDAVRSYVENLPFNGEYTNMALVDTLQGVEGVKVVELLEAEAVTAEEGSPTRINARHTPEAGYFRAGRITLNMIRYK